MSIWNQELPEDVWLVGVSGRVDQTQTSELEEKLDQLLEAGHHRLIVDLSEATYINSGGLRCLVTAWRHARERGGDAYLCCLQPRVHGVFDMVGFDKVFQIYPTRQAAQKAWRQSD